MLWNLCLQKFLRTSTIFRRYLMLTSIKLIAPFNEDDDDFNRWRPPVPKRLIDGYRRNPLPQRRPYGYDRIRYNYANSPGRYPSANYDSMQRPAYSNNRSPPINGHVRDGFRHDPWHLHNPSPLNGRPNFVSLNLHKSLFPKQRKRLSDYGKWRPMDITNNNLERTNKAIDLNDPTSFDKICRNLTNLDYKSVTIHQLSCLPLLSNIHNRQKYFLDIVVKHWWSAFGPLFEKTTSVDYFIKITYIPLSKMNEDTNGSLVEILGSTPIVRMSCKVLDKVVELSPKTFGMFVHALLSLIDEKTSETDKIILLEKLSISYKIFLKLCINGSGKLSQFYAPEIGRLTKRLIRLGMPTPDDESLHHLVRLFSNIFDEKLVIFFTAVDYVWNFYHMASAFLTWNVDPNKFQANFWSLWFEQVAKYYPMLLNETGPANGLILRCVLLVALKFDQEKEFFNILYPLWFDGVKKFHNRLFDDDETKSSIIAEMKQKYSRQPDIIGPMMLEEIIAHIRLI